MTGVRWDIRDIMSQHNAYVDILVRVKTYLPCCNLYSRDKICCFTSWRPLFKIDQKKNQQKQNMKSNSLVGNNGAQSPACVADVFYW